MVRRFLPASGAMGKFERLLSDRMSIVITARWAMQLIHRNLWVALLTVVLITSTVMHAVNMFSFPHYEVDEGTYMGSAWSMFEHGKLSYYTYTYDHPLLGWLQIGAWSELLGGFLAFGSSINTGRSLMLVVAVLSSLMIFLIIRRATGRNMAAFAAALIYSWSPVGVSLHRQVWLDNLATLWLLIAFYALITAKEKESLGHIIVSAVAFGLAYWTKEIFVIFLPGFLYLVFATAHPVHRRFAFVLWGAVSATAVSFFVLMAVLKDELLPPGVLWSSPRPHVSMIETYLFQASRGSAVPPGPFDEFFKQWAMSDPVLVGGGSVVVLLGLLFWQRDKSLFAVSILSLTFILFNARGGVVLFHYVIPLLALLAVGLGLFLGFLSNLAFGRRLLGSVFVLALLAGMAVLGVKGVEANAENLEADSTSVQLTAARWVADNLPEDSVLIMDSYAWVELRDPSWTGEKVFRNAHYYWPAQLDPAIRKRFLHNDWHNIDYFLISASTAENIAADSPAPMPLMKEALSHSEMMRSFKNDHYGVEIYRVHNKLSNSEKSSRSSGRAQVGSKIDITGEAIKP
jgi:4-amino-4-deoxy-L-arabinose transferase-like glycosyltransferase